VPLVRAHVGTEAHLPIRSQPLNGASKWGPPHSATLQLPILHSPHFATARGDGMPHNSPLCNSPNRQQIGGKDPNLCKYVTVCNTMGKKGGNYMHNDGKMGNKPLPNRHTYSYHYLPKLLTEMGSFLPQCCGIVLREYHNMDKKLSSPTHGIK